MMLAPFIFTARKPGESSLDMDSGTASSHEA